jgi:hypothetical protein
MESYNPTKSQEEIRVSFEAKLNILAKSVQADLVDYEARLDDDNFEDKDAIQKSITNKIERLENMKALIDSGEEIPSITSVIQANYEYTNPETKKIENQETITIDLEKKLQEFIDFYTTTTVDIPVGFEDDVRGIWERNGEEIQKAIEEKGFDDVLIIPADLSLVELSKKMKMENGYYDAITSSSTLQDLTGIPLTSTGVDKTRVILVHKTQNLKDRPELKETLGVKAQDIKIDESLSLDDYIIFSKKFNIDTGKHLDEDGWTWTPRTKSGARFVGSCWDPARGELNVAASDAGSSSPDLGCRSSRYFT